METTEKKKKHNGGYYLKEKIAKLEAEMAAKDQRIAGLTLNVESEVKKAKQSAEAERDEWKKDAEAKQTTIEQQSRKISQLTADLKVAQDNLKATNREYERQLKAMYDHMGWFKRMTWDWHHAPTFKEDERWNETH